MGPVQEVALYTTVNNIIITTALLLSYYLWVQMHLLISVNSIHK